MWLVECGALGIFQQKGSFLEAAAKGEERRVRSRLLVPTLLSSLFSASINHSIFLLLVFISVSGSSCRTSGQSHLSSVIIILSLSRMPLHLILTNHFSPTLNSPFLSEPPSMADPAVLQIMWPFEMECAGSGSAMIRADRLFQRSRAAMSDSELGGDCSAA